MGHAHGLVNEMLCTAQLMYEHRQSVSINVSKGVYDVHKSDDSQRQLLQIKCRDLPHDAGLMYEK